MPNHERWEEQGYVDRSLWLAAGEAGYLCPTVDENYGGAGVNRLFSAIVLEELAAHGASGPGFSLHSDIVVPYIQNYGSDELKSFWLPKMVSGERNRRYSYDGTGHRFGFAGLPTISHSLR